MDAVRRVAETHNLWVLEDGAQAHGAAYRGQHVGALADACAFSFYFTKNLGGYGEAGAVTTDNDGIAQALRELRNHGETSKYMHERVGYNSRLDEIHAAVLRIRLRDLEAHNEQRRAHAARYRQGLSDTCLVLPTEADWARHVFHLFVVRSQARDELAAHLNTREIGVSLHYRRPCHLQSAVRGLGIPIPSLPVAESTAGEVLGLPMYPELTEEQQEYVIGCVREFGDV
jgi:dTDP-4-amino-4,6-dideoxygalactose transaminase